MAHPAWPILPVSIGVELGDLPLSSPLAVYVHTWRHRTCT